MKIAVEYMNDITAEGVATPPWVISGGHFFNPNDCTYVGVILDRGSRDYHIPGTVKKLTKGSLQHRNLKISHPQDNATNAELTNAHNTTIEWWDTYITSQENNL